MKRVAALFCITIFTAGTACAIQGDLGVTTQPLTDGSVDYPWLIEDLADFDAFCATSDYWVDSTRLMCDLDLSGRIYTQAPVAPDLDITTMFEYDPFMGIFDGNGHVISNLTIEGHNYVGLFGYIHQGTIFDLGVTNVQITASGSIIGGLTGMNQGTTTRCYTTGLISGGSMTGGLVGINHAPIESCYSTVNISKSFYDVGGLCGYSEACIRNSYTTGDVSGAMRVGGLTGRNTADIACCFSSGTIAGNKSGGLTGVNDGSTVSSYFFDIRADNGHGLPLSNAQLQDPSCFAGFDFAANPADGTADVWTSDPGYMPRLAWQDPPGFTAPSPLITTTLQGSGYPGDPFILADANDFQEFRNNTALRGGYYQLVNDIDMAGSVYPDAFIREPFGGHLFGNGHVIRNLTIEGTGSLGFFAEIDTKGFVTGLGLEAVRITGTDRYVGGLCAVNKGHIRDSYATGTLSGTVSIGGLCGMNRSRIESCYADCTVTGTYFAGGLCGQNGSSISNCYAKGTLTCTGNDIGSDDVGGLCGQNGASISNCFSTTKVTLTHINNTGGGLVGNLAGNVPVLNSFWDTDTSTLTVSAGGTGLFTAEMQTLSTFTEAGWDFVGESVNGTEDIWKMRQVVYYPILAWQKDIPGDIVFDGRVDASDFSVFAENWQTDHTVPDFFDNADITRDGAVGLNDLDLLVANWLQ